MWPPSCAGLPEQAMLPYTPAQGRQDQNFQHGSLLYPSSNAAMW